MSFQNAPVTRTLAVVELGSLFRLPLPINEADFTQMTRLLHEALVRFW
jgi:hypothetical protein